jgi:hypothetical protein
MADHSAAMTTARMQIVLLRLQGLTLSALVQRGILRPEWAAGLVEDAAKHLSAQTNDPAIEGLLAGALAQVAQEMRDTQSLVPFRD